jgi:polysaccharide pyruvyl transferase WcaK-like protein
MSTKIVITDVYDLRHNYGVQGLVLPLVDKIRDLIDVQFVMPVQSAYFTPGNIDFAAARGITLVSYWKYSFLFEVFHPFIRKPGSLLSRLIISIAGDQGKEALYLYHELVKQINDAEKVIDVAGIEFIGNSGIKKKWGELLFCRMFQKLAAREGKPYYKYTKSYGPIEGQFFRLIVKDLLNKLPFVFVRGKKNLEELEKINISTPLFLFPDVSLVLKPSNQEQAKQHLKSAGLDTSLPVAGISPSRVLSKISSNNNENCVGENHIELVRRLIDDFLKKGYQVLIIPHAVDLVDRKKCDRELANEILKNLNSPKGVFIVPEGLSYSEVRGVIGQLSFYVTGRYHSVASALYMETPVVSLSWHIKYTDIMSEFLDEFLSLDSRNTGIDEAMNLIEKYHDNLTWFDKEKLRENRDRIEREIERSIRMMITT